MYHQFYPIKSHKTIKTIPPLFIKSPFKSRFKSHQNWLRLMTSFGSSPRSPASKACSVLVRRVQKKWMLTPSMEYTKKYRYNVYIYNHIYIYTYLFIYTYLYIRIYIYRKYLIWIYDHAKHNRPNKIDQAQPGNGIPHQGCCQHPTRKRKWQDKKVKLPMFPPFVAINLPQMAWNPSSRWFYQPIYNPCVYYIYI